MMMRWAAIVLIILVAVVAIWFIWQPKTATTISSIENSVKNFSAPAPLINLIGSSTSAAAVTDQYTLTRAGVIADTNTQRAQNGNLAPLAENATLDEIASLRLQDMFAKQYFAHISPSSSSAITVADSLGYEYISLGENLALGSFEGDQGVVTAWMNSPGHRANILDPTYTEIGVAVGSGMFQGGEAWIAVQEFGRPLSACPQPDASLEAMITANQTQILVMEAKIQSDQAQLDTQNEASVDAYNTEINQYNALTTQTKTEVAEYNAGVGAYNACIGAPSSSLIIASTSSQ